MQRVVEIYNNDFIIQRSSSKLVVLIELEVLFNMNKRISSKLSHFDHIMFTMLLLIFRIRKPKICNVSKNI